MKLSELRSNLKEMSELVFDFENGKSVPAHFHLTEAGLRTKHFIDCGGTVREEKAVTFQLWTADDYDHRLSPAKLESIIQIAEPLFKGEDLEVEAEYQGETVGRYAIGLRNGHFLLQATQTDCLAREKCALPEDKTQKPKIRLSDLNKAEAACCSPESGCC